MEAPGVGTSRKQTDKNRPKGSDMRRLVAPSIVIAVAGFAMGTIYRCLWDDPNEASVANYLRSGVHGMVVAASGWGSHLYFNLRGSGWLKKMAAAREVALRAIVTATTVAVVIASLQVVIYDRHSQPRGCWPNSLGLLP
jgi:adenylate cyclase